jgi:hypothetical protein
MSTLIGWRALGDYASPLRGFLFRLIGFAAAAAGLLAVAPATAPAEPRATTFVHSAKSGELQGSRLTLRGVPRNVTWVSQDGRSGVLSVATLHRGLFAPAAPPGFPGSNRSSRAPTAALHVGQRPGSVVALRLSRPRYNASARTLSYRVKRLNKRRVGSAAQRPGAGPVGRAAQQPTRQFGPASLSIAAPASPLDTYHCTTTVANLTDYTIEATASGLWPNDTWNPAIPSGALLIPSQSSTLVYGSDGGFMRGCGDSSTWTIVDGPPGVQGVTFSFYATIPYDDPGRVQGSCTPSASNFVCAFDQGSNNAWWLCATGSGGVCSTSAPSSSARRGAARAAGGPAAR